MIGVHFAEIGDEAEGGGVLRELGDEARGGEEQRFVEVRAVQPPQVPLSYSGYSKLRTLTALGSYGRAIPRSKGPS